MSICFDTKCLNISVLSYKFVEINKKAETTRAPVHTECIKKSNKYLLKLLKLKPDNIYFHSFHDNVPTNYLSLKSAELSHQIDIRLIPANLCSLKVLFILVALSIKELQRKV